MKKISLILLAAIAISACKGKRPANYQDSASAASAKKGEWINLLADSTMAGWHTYGKGPVGAAWHLKDGELHLDASKKADWQSAGGGDIVTDEEYENFDLKVEWKISRAGNSGIMFYVHEDTTQYKYPWQTGPETQIADNKENEDGKLIKHRAGDLYDLMSIDKEIVNKAGSWNKTEVIANKGQLTILVNHEVVLKTTLWDANWKKLIAGSKFKEFPGFGTYKKGRIALQDHGADVWFKKVEIKKL
ncbi:3-keto-disaccharide hydrolase [Mucilaginibacter phyllosphaerae]|uniref:DUF1080 domain-containing protein n=1 Tax=Mucilaginibacter phyllosphaerae TaxID=1812349 RepID=A0A4Y8AK16_9SPHI|nr:DUF1080 domain-containing protein [Mucilaginibacter phyllosphaerae]MBB3967992.1 hypothetical protein [Mucilaginibacter phyllosphaerae]TEW68982.1 DUF1080 domain-containing protein [Mucilaginibacter phyllosphaerae]GGH01964.1 glycosyl hydrolase [Mucilaginibacter phyllosphaerae]